MMSDYFVPITEAAHRLENIKMRAFQVREMRENITPYKFLEIKMIGGLSLLMIAIGYRIEMFPLPLDEAVVFFTHLLA
jgi:hypothetical protein